jgi:lysophospholipid acyltransferase (LPLAT)-like uncharacterized protein
MIRRTARYQLHGKERLDALEAAGRPIIWTSWHGTSLMGFGYLWHHFAGMEPTGLVVVSDDWRGEMYGEWMRIGGGIKAFPMSMEEGSLVAARRLLKLVRELKKGMNAFIWPDGPDGPAGIPKPGVSFIASRSGAAVLPCGVYTRTRYEMRRWDRYSLPFLYSRITIFFGEPLTITPDENVQAAGQRIAAAINQAMAEAEARHHQ